MKHIKNTTNNIKEETEEKKEKKTIPLLQLTSTQNTTKPRSDQNKHIIKKHLIKLLIYFKNLNHNQRTT